MADEIVIGAALVEIRAGIDKLNADFQKAKSEAKKGASEIQSNLNNIKIQMDDRLLKLKISDVQRLHTKLKQRLEEKIKLNYDLQSIEVTRKQLDSVKNALRDIKTESDKLPKSGGSGLGDLFGKVSGISATQLSVAGISAGLGVVIADSVKASIEIEGVRNAFNRLNQPNLLDDLRKATRGTVNDFELMKTAMRASNFKIPLEQLGTLLEFAQKRASQTGENVDYLVNSIVDGIGRKSTLVLDNLGISATELQEEVKKVGDFGQATGNIVSRELGKMGDVALTTKDNISQITTELDNVKVAIGDAALQSTNWFIELAKSQDKIQTILNILNDVEGKEERKTDAQRAYNKELSDTVRLTKEKVNADAITANSSQIEKRIDDVRKRIAEFSKLPVNSSIADLEKYFEALKGEGKLKFSPLITELKSYIEAHKELKTIFDPYANTLNQITDRIELLKGKLGSFKPGDSGLAATQNEIKKLENILNPKSTDSKKIKADFSEFSANQEDTAWFEEQLNLENEIKQQRIDNLQLYADAKREISEEEKKNLEERFKREEEIHNLRMNAISEFGNALEGLGSHSETFVSYLNAGLQAALKIADALDKMKTDELSGILGIASGGMGFLSKLLGLKKGGSVTNSGGNISFQPHKSFASGTPGFTVPPGFNRDNYLVGVQSGERLTVTPANQKSNNSSGMNDATLKLIANRIGAMNGNLINGLDELVNVNVNKALETKLQGTDIVISYDKTSKVKTRYN